MPNKSPESKRNHGRRRDTDTSSYAQAHGAPDAPKDPNQRNESMPHERDESARSTGNRLDETPSPSQHQISQAHDDVEEGQVDTDRRGIPSDVPGARK
jgi:hypothetical protein